MTRQTEKIASVLRANRPQPSVATIGEKRLWNAMVGELAKILIPAEDRADLLTFVRKTGGRLR